MERRRYWKQYPALMRGRRGYQWQRPTVTWPGLAQRRESKAGGNGNWGDLIGYGVSMPLGPNTPHYGSVLTPPPCKSRAGLRVKTSAEPRTGRVVCPLGCFGHGGGKNSLFDSLPRRLTPMR